MSLSNWEKVSRSDPGYKACLTGTTAALSVVGGMTGAAAGGLGAVPGYAAGALYGFIAGYLACPYLVPLIRGKIESGEILSEYEMRSAAESMGRYAQLSGAPDAVRLLAMIRQGQPKRLGSPACVHPAYVAQQLLRQA